MRSLFSPTSFAASSRFGATAVNPLLVLLRVAIAAGYLWTAWLLCKRRELGGVLGLAFLGLSVVPRILVGGRFVSGSLLIPILEAIGLALAWSYLDDADAPEREPTAKSRARAVGDGGW